MFRMKANEELTLSVINKFASKHKVLVDRKYKKLLDAYLTNYDITKQSPKASWKPDNRLQANFAKYSVDTMTGFFTGIPPTISSSDDAVNEYVYMINAYNVFDDLLAEEMKNACIFGRDYELLYVDECGQIGIARSNPMTSFIIYDDSVIERKRAFVRLYRDADKRITGSVSDEYCVRYFELSPSLHWTSEEYLHGFNGVPAVEWRLNDDRTGLFEPIMSLLNAYNKIISEKANDIDSFADAYMKILGAELDESQIRNIRSDRVINFGGTDADKLVVDFLAKPDADASQEHILDRLESLMFKISMVADVSDDNFAGQSGIALQYKMLSMSNMAKFIERKFKGAFQERYRLIFSNPANRMNEDDFVKLNYTFTRNFPANLSDEAQIARNLEGVVSKETQLRILSVVENPKEELERIEEENSVVNPLDMRYEE